LGLFSFHFLFFKQFKGEHNMAKVGRAAFNSSRMRVETLTGNKTIATAEAGEVYLVNAAREITLPAAQDGAYFKVIVNTKFAGNTNLVISASGGALLKGGIAIVAAGSVNNISDVGEANGTDHNTLRAPRRISASWNIC
jgi:hypothetical protein